ncbi:MAG: hypothetical protein C4542_05985 [Dehalococcoidia bacterium]|nr:MAG: hypothetical protein C4542_05985 [Dehalococcoidia bacterium]
MKWFEKHLNLTLAMAIFVCYTIAYFITYGLIIGIVLAGISSAWYLGNKNRSMGWYILWCWVTAGASYSSGYASLFTPILGALFLLPLKNKSFKTINPVPALEPDVQYTKTGAGNTNE